MFNTPILDIAIGLVFIFLLYSLLATSVKEAIATALGLRARMLRKGIVQGMLSNTPDYNRWQSIGVAIWEYICEFVWLITGRPKNKEKKIGDYFYEHPLIKNYGENKIYPTPSYIKTGNFSTVLLDVLKKDFDEKINDIANVLLKKQGNTLSLEQIKIDLLSGVDIAKIKSLLEYYAHCYATGTLPAKNLIDKDTLDILQLHLKGSLYGIETFTKKIEEWFNDSMDRVSGWYKRQVQVILFLIGLCFAITFNIDIIEITKKLSKDDTLREQVVQSAIAYGNQHSQQEKEAGAAPGNKTDSTADSAYLKEVEMRYNRVDSMVNHDMKDINTLMALGWGDYGMARDSAASLKKYEKEYKEILTKLQRDTGVKNCHGDSACRTLALKTLYGRHWIVLKIGYILSTSFHAVKFLGFALLALGVCLGAPFWFDMLSKLINIRGAGKQESTNPPSKQSTTPVQPAPQQH